MLYAEDSGCSASFLGLFNPEYPWAALHKNRAGDPKQQISQGMSP